MKELKCPLCKRILYTSEINDEKYNINGDKKPIPK